MTWWMVDSIDCLSEARPQESIARRLTQGVAWADLVITFPLALPVTAPAFVNVIYYCNSFLGGQVSQPALSQLAWFFINLAGVLGVFWAVVRLVSPYQFLACADAFCRCFVVVLLLYYILKGFVPIVFAVFVATEALGAMLEFTVFGR